MISVKWEICKVQIARPCNCFWKTPFYCGLVFWNGIQEEKWPFAVCWFPFNRSSWYPYWEAFIFWRAPCYKDFGFIISKLCTYPAIIPTTGKSKLWRNHLFLFIHIQNLNFFKWIPHGTVTSSSRGSPFSAIVIRYACTLDWEFFLCQDVCSLKTSTFLTPFLFFVLRSLGLVSPQA